MVSVPFNRHCAPASIGDSRNRLRNREGKNASCTREFLMHPRNHPASCRQCARRRIWIREECRAILIRTV